jgi:predicted ATPase/DNA-binding CsgD family transcriptional regulator
MVMPVQSTHLIGREKEIGEIKTTIANFRLITLIGPAGTGKTRLALQLATELTSKFADGVAFISLTPIHDQPDLVLAAISQALKVVKPQADLDDVLDRIITYLQDKQILLVLDNFEHVLSSAKYLAGLLSGCPNLKILVTSRILLQLNAEVYYYVPPLELPNPEKLPPFEKLVQYSAIALFLERAKQANSDFKLTEKNLSEIARICVQLDGLPLAIELAAVRSRVYPPEIILQRLRDRFKLLSAGKQDLAPHQQTLYTTVDWSYQLLTVEQRKFFNRLAVFVDGFTLDAAEIICQNEEENLNVIDLLQYLVDSSLLQSKNNQNTLRFRMLETIREFATEQFKESEEETNFRLKHASYYQTLAATAKTNLNGAEQALWLEKLDLEIGNIRASLNWTLQKGIKTLLFETCAVLWNYWHIRSYLDEAKWWLSVTTNLIDIQVPQKLQAQVLNGYGVIEFTRCAYDQALQYYEKALLMWQTLGNKTGSADVLSNIGIVYANLNAHEQSKNYFEKSLNIRLEVNDERGVATSYNNLSLAYSELNQLPEAIKALEKSLEIRQKLNDQQGIAICQLNLGRMLGKQGEFNRAVKLILQSIEMHLQLKNLRRVAFGIAELAILCAENKKLKLAAHLFGASEALRHRIGTLQHDNDKKQYDKNFQEVKKRLTGQNFQRFYEEGSALDLNYLLTFVQTELNIAENSKPTFPAGLIGEEVEILRLMAKGLTNRQIAEKRNYSTYTIRNKISEIYQKIITEDIEGTERHYAIQWAKNHDLL